MRKVFCATLGCDKNLVDSEALLGRFAGQKALASLAKAFGRWRRKVSQFKNLNAVR